MADLGLAMDETRLNTLLDRFPRLHLLVVGDFFLDKYLSIDPALSEISLETGLEAYQVVNIRHSPGAAGTVTANLRAMDVQVSVVGVIGRDGEGFDLRCDLEQMGVGLEGLIEAPDRFTPTYTKPVRRGAGPDGVEQELNRLDIKNRQPLPEQYQAAVIDHLRRLAPAVHGVVIADQVQERDCGVITGPVRAELARLAAAWAGKPFVADSRMRIGEFSGVWLKPNLSEARAAVERLPAAGSFAADPGKARGALAQARAYGLALLAAKQTPLFITLGPEGILAVTPQETAHIPGIPVPDPIDIVGAGDSVMAGVAAVLAAGGTAKEAAFLGNLAASITIQQLGTTGTASPGQLRQQYARLAAARPSLRLAGS